MIFNTKSIGVFCAVLLAAVSAFTAMSLFTSSATRWDFHLRLAEVDCVKRGVDPFLVWNESVVVKPYYSNNPDRKSVPEGCTQEISVYVPWGYGLLLPFSFLSSELLWWGFSAFSFFLLAFVVYITTKRIGWLASVPMLVVSYAGWSNFQQGNYAVLMLAAAVAMAVCLNRGWNVLAGLFWMLLMIKPQIGLVFAVPLALRMRFLTGAVSAGACLVLSVPAILLCRPDLPEFFYEAAQASAFAYQGCGTWPKFLCGYLGVGADVNAGLVIGAVVCFWMTCMLRRERDWMVYLMPAAICSSCWTYTQAFSHVMGWFVVYAMVLSLVRNPGSRFLWTLFVLSVPVLSRVFLAWHGFCSFFGFDFPLSEYAYRCVDSLNSTMSLAVAFAFCLWRHRELENEKVIQCDS